jgi:hypothetical protein
MNKYLFSYFVTPDEISFYCYKFSNECRRKKDIFWLYPRFLFESLASHIQLIENGRTNSNFEILEDNSVIRAFNKIEKNTELTINRKIILSMIITTILDGKRSIVQRIKQRNIRNLPLKGDLIENQLLRTLEKNKHLKLREDIMKINISELVSSTYEAVINKLQLKDFSLPRYYKYFALSANIIKDMSPSPELLQELEAVMNNPDKWHHHREHRIWLDNLINRYPDEKLVIDKLIPEFKTPNQVDFAMMALETMHNEIVLTLVNDQGQSYSLNRYQLIHLMEPEHRTKTLVTCSEGDYKKGKTAVAEVIGAFDMESGRLIIAEGEKGKPITNDSGFVAKYSFDIDINQLISYYIIFKQEWTDRLEFEELLNRAKPEPHYDLLAN